MHKGLVDLVEGVRLLLLGGRRRADLMVGRIVLSVAIVAGRLNIHTVLTHSNVVKNAVDLAVVLVQLLKLYRVRTILIDQLKPESDLLVSDLEMISG